MEKHPDVPNEIRELLDPSRFREECDESMKMAMEEGSVLRELNGEAPAEDDKMMSFEDFIFGQLEEQGYNVELIKKELDSISDPTARNELFEEHARTAVKGLPPISEEVQRKGKLERGKRLLREAIQLYWKVPQKDKETVAGYTLDSAHEDLTEEDRARMQPNLTEKGLSAHREISQKFEAQRKKLEAQGIDTSNIASDVFAVNQQEPRKPTRDVEKSPLDALHKSLNATTMTIGKVELPLEYPTGYVNEVLHTRASASFFDLHNLKVLALTGEDREGFVQLFIPGNLSKYPALSMHCGAFLMDFGGIGGLCTVIPTPTMTLFIVEDHQFEYIFPRMASFAEKYRETNIDVKVDVLDVAMIALQGPKAASVLQRHVDGKLSKLRWRYGQQMNFEGDKSLILRFGYTGEDGFEMLVKRSRVTRIASLLLGNFEVLPAGHLARETLRVEAGYPQYGCELQPNVSLLDATMPWTYDVQRAMADETTTKTSVHVTGTRRYYPFIGQEGMQLQLQNGANHVRVGLITEDLVVPEDRVFTKTGVEVGWVGASQYSPTIKAHIATAFIKRELARPGNTVMVGEPQPYVTLEELRYSAAESEKGNPKKLRVFAKTCTLPFVPRKLVLRPEF
eukprot:gnl/Spiro4/14103_TR7576_c0_g1_i1.p1 gnl/Spiro4/14103_TR7576_c0_g1~~gnl/Spiro4/14103_TR7576_c0_g1_i1.p1  ORF type:complete len:715 (-),score=203.01 gnl/Spiro4/14103_TR7576_c0_g1_i1:87-1955(-)